MSWVLSLGRLYIFNVLTLWKTFMNLKMEKETLCKDAKKQKENVGKCFVFHNSKPMQFVASKCNMWTHDLLHDSTQHDH
jgi:hypothetical protein